ncbi:MAG: threonine/serine dehydratase [Bacteroidota bacterium]
MNTLSYPTIKRIRAAREQLGKLVRTTPVLQWAGPAKDHLLGQETEVYIKLELLQHGGSFKPRGALVNMLSMDKAARKRGVTAVSAGNHAIAVGYASQVIGTTAKVVMPSNANPFRVRRCQDYGAEVVLVDNVTEAFATVKAIEEEEGKTFIHPFEGEGCAIGTGMVGMEFAEQVDNLDAVILPIGGGGLAAGMAAAIHQLQPACQLLGVEPTGADSMSRSFQTGKPEKIDKVRSIADSLGAPFALPYSFTICKELIEEIVLVEDDALRNSMKLMFSELKLAAEPACAASLTALLGPLKEKLSGQKVGVIACGSNIDPDTFFSYLNP